MVHNLLSVLLQEGESFFVLALSLEGLDAEQSDLAYFVALQLLLLIFFLSVDLDHALAAHEARGIVSSQEARRCIE